MPSSIRSSVVVPDRLIPLLMARYRASASGPVSGARTQVTSVNTTPQE
jgi:hypothetical protein